MNNGRYDLDPLSISLQERVGLRGSVRGYRLHAGSTRQGGHYQRSGRYICHENAAGPHDSERAAIHLRSQDHCQDYQQQAL